MARQLELENPRFDFSDYNPRTRQLHEITIRTFYGFRVFDPEARWLLLKEIAGIVRSQLKPKLMLWLCVDALIREKIEVPSYTRLTKLVLGAINRRKQELATIIEQTLDQDVQKNQVATLKETLVSELSEDDYYRILESKSVWIQNRVGPILKAVTFQGDPGTRKLLDAIEHFKEKEGAIDKTAPVTFLDPTEVAAVNKDSRFRVSLYKALLFLHVQSAIKSGGLNLEHSYKYRPLDDYLIDRARWQRDKQQLIERAGLDAFVDPRKVLDELDEALHRQYLITNGNITEGKNSHVKFGKNGGFTVATPKQEESDTEPLQHFFPKRSYVPLLEILSTVNRYTHYVDELQHWQQRYHRRRPSEPTIFAGVIGIGCMIGLRKMMRISHPINEAELEHTVNWHFSVDGLQAASDRVLQLTGRLGIAQPLAPLPRSFAYLERRQEIRGTRRFPKRQLLVQTLRQGPRRQRLHLPGRARPAVVLHRL